MFQNLVDMVSIFQKWFFRKCLVTTAHNSSPAFKPNPIEIRIVNFPDAMTEDEQEILKKVFHDNLIKAGGLGGVYRALKTAPIQPDSPIEFYSTHRPFLVVKEMGKRELELGLNAIAEKYIAGKTYSELKRPENSLGVLLYEVDEAEDVVVDAWEIPTVYWSRTDMDGRHDPRLLYLDLAGEVVTGMDVLNRARLLHEVFSVNN